MTDAIVILPSYLQVASEEDYLLQKGIYLGRGCFLDFLDVPWDNIVAFG